MHEFRQKFDEDFLETAYNNRQLFTREVLKEIKKYLQAKNINAVYKIPRSLHRLTVWSVTYTPSKACVQSLFLSMQNQRL